MLPGLISTVHVHAHRRACQEARLYEQREGIHIVVVGRLETLSCSVIRVTRARLKIFCSTASEDILEKWPLKQITSGEPLKITTMASEKRSISL